MNNDNAESDTRVRQKGYDYSCTNCGKQLEIYEQHNFYDCNAWLKISLMALAKAVLEFENEYKVDGLHYAETCNRLFELAREVVSDKHQPD